MKYLKYYISTLTLIIAFHVCFLGEFYPTIFFFCFSSFIIIGDLVIKEDTKEQNYTKLFLLDLPMYLNFPILTIILILATFFLSDAPSNVFTNVISSYLSIDLVEARNSMNFFDSIFLVIQMGLFIGIMGTVPGHELVHRKKNKLDLSMGNWLLALSWDCAFAVEHVHGHHKNVGLSIDPATAKRGENIYKFIINATLKEHKDAWKIELGRLKKRGISFYSMKNKMILGYIRSAIIRAIFT